MSDRIAKLPKWAQELIADQERTIVQQHRMLAQQANTEKTRVVLDEGMTDDYPALFHAPDDVRVRFYLKDDRPGGGYIDVYLQDEDRGIELQGSGPMQVAPWVTNSWLVQLRKD